MMPRPMENGDRVLTKLETENCLSSAEVFTEIRANLFGNKQIEKVPMSDVFADKVQS